MNLTCSYCNAAGNLRSSSPQYLVLFALHDLQAELLTPLKDIKLAQPNFQYEKRQKELAKKKKQEDKRLRKLAEKNPDPAAAADLPADEGKV